MEEAKLLSHLRKQVKQSSLSEFLLERIEVPSVQACLGLGVMGPVPSTRGAGG